MRFRERAAHRGFRAASIFGGCGRMMRVARRAVAAKFGEDVCAACNSVVPALEDEIAGAFAEGDAFAGGVEGRAWIGIDGLRSEERRVGKEAEGGAAAGDRDVGVM